jgi:hypothetical protein
VVISLWRSLEFNMCSFPLLRHLWMEHLLGTDTDLTGGLGRPSVRCLPRTQCISTLTLKLMRRTGSIAQE